MVSLTFYIIRFEHPFGFHFCVSTKKVSNMIVVYLPQHDCCIATMGMEFQLSFLSFGRAKSRSYQKILLTRSFPRSSAFALFFPGSYTLKKGYLRQAFENASFTSYFISDRGRRALQKRRRVSFLIVGQEL